MKIDIVTGVGYGDEGKGVTTKWLCKTSSSNPLVVRYGGGHQVGHTVMDNGFLHTHHHTGAGTTEGVPTYYSEFCTVDPIKATEEILMLSKKGYKVNNIYHPKCMIVTPLDVLSNRASEKIHSHGSVGVGFGATIKRTEQHYGLRIMDITNPYLFKEKCKLILDDYYFFQNNNGADAWNFEWDIDEFYQKCSIFLELVHMRTHIPNNYDHLVFEGHQGTLLDMEYGLFPHVTRSKTTCKNVWDILDWNRIYKSNVTNYMITRCYHTRHANGPFEETELKLINNENETNKDTGFQGRFKYSELDLSLLQSGIMYNLADQRSLDIKNKLVVTCCDQLENSEEVLEAISEVFPYDILTNSSPESNLKS